MFSQSEEVITAFAFSIRTQAEIVMGLDTMTAALSSLIKAQAISLS
jgi:hypothetical protein